MKTHQFLGLFLGLTNVSYSLPLKTVAKLKLVAAAVLGGTDYAPCVRGKSFGTARKVALGIGSVVKADELLLAVRFSSLLNPGMPSSLLTASFLLIFAMLTR